SAWRWLRELALGTYPSEASRIQPRFCYIQRWCLACCRQDGVLSCAIPG
ncbi:unnamed protein product, partial [Ectocarpus sp. 8 AP-2014]